MPWSGGTYTRNNGVYTGATVWSQDQAGGYLITTAHHDTHDQDLAAGINNCVTKDGQSQMTADFKPFADATYNLGGASNRWKNLLLSGGAVFSYGSYTTTISSGAISGNVAWTLPAADGAANAVLKTNGSGALSFSSTGIGSASGTNAFSASTTLTAAQAGALILFTGSSASQTITLPAASSVGQGSSYWIINQATVSVSVAGNGTDNISKLTNAGVSTSTSAVTLAPGDFIRFVSNGATIWQMIGMLQANLFASPTFTGTPVLTNAASTFKVQATSGTSKSQIDGVAATNRILSFTTANGNRWSILADPTAESGSNAGSNFGIVNYSDAGTALNTVLSFNRATGVGSFYATPLFPTVSLSDNSTNGATTAFVKGQSYSVAPTASAGVGQWVAVTGSTLPAGGTWAYYVMTWASGGGTIYSGAGVAAGGSTMTLNSGSFQAFIGGIAWRVA